MEHPTDLDVDRLDRLRRQVHPFAHKPAALKDVLSALMGVEYRYSACAAHDQAFTALFAKEADGTHTRYQQERELFAFFVTGQSSIECATFAAYRYASCVAPTAFDLQAHVLKARSVTSAFEKSYPREAITSVLKGIHHSPEWERWKKARNILIHQSHPGRSISNVGPTEWLGVPFGATFTAERRRWLSGALSDPIREMESFFCAYPV